MIIPIEDIVKDIRISTHNPDTIIIAIDGYGGSGKSRLANEIAKQDTSVAIVQFDYFYSPGLYSNGKPPLPDFDWRRLEKEVLIPIRQNQDTRYQQYDWVCEKPGGWIELSAGNTLIIEGVSSMNSGLLKYYDYKIWVDCPLDIRLERARERDGGEMTDTWLNEWIPAEDNYVKNEEPYRHADLIFDGSGLSA